MPVLLSKTPNHKEYEPRILEFWQKGAFFKTPPHPSSPPYTILMPPPNVTSKLHMGHGTGYTLQDWLIRWKRMSTGSACWIPGLDHAGIATQMMVEKDLESCGLSKHDLGREAFVKKAQEWKEAHGQVIVEQFLAMGFSYDPSRLAYTMDPERSRAVRYAFVKFFEEGLIYRHHRLVHWDPTLQTALGDDEVENKEISGHLYHINYPLAEEAEKFITIATTRPETMLADVAVAVHPEDERYRSFIGKKLSLPLCEREIPILADDYVKPEFGTGALKITPAHDPQDYLIGERHNLEAISIFDDQARINENAPSAFRGLERKEARREVIRLLKDQNLVVKIEDYRHSVPHSERSGAIIEPKLCPQWYVKTKELALPIAEAARKEEIRFYPASWKKTWLHWLDNIQDWCISRQLWWGHRIPVWDCQDCKATFSNLEDPEVCPQCGSKHILQDEDVLDTWFSSWLWPLSPFGWPQKDHELESFFPSQVLITAPEIIFLWVARMAMAGWKFQGQLPFKEVFFNATVCDKQGRKFSKTLGNGIDPLDVIEEYGADALRYTAAHIAPMAGRIKMERSDFRLGRNFLTKIWNAARFLANYTHPNQKLLSLKDQPLSLWQRGLLEDLRQAAQNVEQALGSYRTHEAVRIMYAFVWNSFCDEALEASKPTLTLKQGPDPLTLSFMIYIWDHTLRLLHPLLPFVTEELWGKFPAHPDLERKQALTISKYPSQLPLPSYPLAWKLWREMENIITSIRRLKQTSTLNLKDQSVEVFLHTDALKKHLQQEDSQATSLIQELQESHALIAILSHTPQVSFHNAATSKSMRNVLVDVEEFFDTVIFLEERSGLGDEIARLKKEQAKKKKFLESTEKRLNSPHFQEKADPEIKAGALKQKHQLQRNIAALERTLESFATSS